jgi:cytochrome P450
MQGFADLGAYSMARIRERRAAPGEDLISRLVEAKIDGEPLDDARLQGLMTVIFLAGLDTVAGMLGFITRFLATSPAHRQELRAHPERIGGAVDEFLRRMAMVNLCREVDCDTELGGVALKRGELVIAPTALCNFPEDGQDWLAVDFRRPKPRLRDATFGIGGHYCPGAGLAHAEIRIFLEEWLTRIPDFAIPEGTRLEVKIGAAVTLASLPLTWTPRARSFVGGS